MAKITLNNVVNFQNEGAAASTINNNSAAIVAAVENTLSRDGTTPNQMSAQLDMNSNRILNLPAPISNDEPARLVDIGNAAVSAASAAASAIAAGVSATGAATSASAASTSAANAATSATAASTAATSAANSAAALAFKYTWSTNTTSSDPTSGKIKVNNAAPGSATALFISETDANGNSLSAEIARWGATAASAGRARLKITKDATDSLLLTVTSTVTDNGTWDTYTVGSGSLTGSFLDGDTVYIQPSVSGADGSGVIGGAAHQIALYAGAASITGGITALTDGQLVVGQTGADPLGKTVSGDATMASTGALTVTKTSGTSFAPIATSGSASDLSTGTLPAGRFPALTGNVTTVAGALATTIAAGVVTFAMLASAAVATSAQYLANTASKVLTTDQVWGAAALTTLTDGATVTPDFSLGIDFTWTIGATGRTLANPTNPKVGQKGIIYIVEDGTGSRTITTWGTSYKFSGGVKPVLSTAAASVDILSYAVKSSTEIECFFTQGMS